MFLTITIELGNDAMRSSVDVLDSIKHCRLAAEDHTPMLNYEAGSISDKNGNTVGFWFTSDNNPVPAENITLNKSEIHFDTEWLKNR